MDLTYCSKCGKMIPPGGPGEGQRFLVAGEPVCPKCYRQIPENGHTGGTMMVSDAVGPQPVAGARPPAGMPPRPRTTKLNLPASKPPSGVRPGPAAPPGAARSGPALLLWAAVALLVLGALAAWLLLGSSVQGPAGGNRRPGPPPEGPRAVSAPPDRAQPKPRPAEPPPADRKEPPATVPPLATAGPVFRESGGLVVMEAENFSAQHPGTGDGQVTSWAQTTDVAGFSGAGALRALPQDPKAYFPKELIGSRLDYRVAFATAGTYRVWIRMAKGPDDCDTVHIGLDGAQSGGVRCSQTAWQWASTDGAPSRVPVPAAGVHVFNIWMRESRTCIDRIILASDEAFKPDGAGPAESPRLP